MVGGEEDENRPPTRPLQISTSTTTTGMSLRRQGSCGESTGNTVVLISISVSVDANRRVSFSPLDVSVRSSEEDEGSCGECHASGDDSLVCSARDRCSGTSSRSTCGSSSGEGGSRRLGDDRRGDLSIDEARSTLGADGRASRGCVGRRGGERRDLAHEGVRAVGAEGRRRDGGDEVGEGGESSGKEGRNWTSEASERATEATGVTGETHGK